MSKPAARAVADLDDGVIHAAVDIEVPPERVFEALTSGPEVMQWWGAPGEYQVTGWTGDLKPGGKWRSEGVGADGAPFFVEGEFLEIDPPRRLVQTWRPQWDGGNTTTVTFTLAGTATGTRLTLRHEGFEGRPESCRNHTQGWELVLGWLAGFLNPPSPADQRKYYLVRLVPPRPDFAYTLTPDERAMMNAHAAYWRGQMARGNVVVFGPVNDPAGNWGLGVLRVGSEDELTAFQSHDPAMLAGCGFRYESAPMLAAIWREP
jgi:uncharacterized protein YndB with AHSA1/START domain